VRGSFPREKALSKANMRWALGSLYHDKHVGVLVTSDFREPARRALTALGASQISAGPQCLLHKGIALPLLFQ